MIDSDLLLENPIFASLESRQLDLLCAKVAVHSYAQDEWIVHLEEVFSLRSLGRSRFSERLSGSPTAPYWKELPRRRNNAPTGENA